MAQDNGVRLLTGTFRAAFVNVFEARKAPGNDRPSFSLVAIFDKEDPALKPLKEAALQAVKKRWPDGPPANLKKPFKDGATKAQWDGFGPGKVFITMKTYQRPGVVGPDRTPIVDASEFYSGCYARATVSAFADVHKVGGAYVSFFLNNLQKVKDGAPFGRTNAENDFDAIEGAAPSGGAPAPAPAAGDSLFE